MRLKILGFVCVCLLLFVGSGTKFNHAKAEAIIQEDPEMAEQSKKEKMTMKEIATITTALVDYIKDNGIAPEQDGTYDENTEFCKALAPYYVRNLPIYDGWGNNYIVYCREACNGKYGISGCISDDVVVVSYGRDGKKENWEFDPNNPGAGLYVLEALDDFDRDLIMWNGSWIRAPRPGR
ncbi:MAG: hypothetical protein ACFFDN_39855 [Candidatus Hodarchaeota archaeon]